MCRNSGCSEELSFFQFLTLPDGSTFLQVKMAEQVPLGQEALTLEYYEREIERARAQFESQLFTVQY